MENVIVYALIVVFLGGILGFTAFHALAWYTGEKAKAERILVTGHRAYITLVIEMLLSLGVVYTTLGPPPF